ncbi:hypothetical protein NPIL_251701 [Nephila pilipes]|uniref:Uncharacterized protein n=1 Tax=Nephila pilipes TaxID=299642 RepID=A0A8X6QPP6_NEPPI|nr:hypothetical protein NPIL_630171 [Nephila pilipes]GFU37643.1 hypothetical protein NPIL_251701 [Nephila pilipes]
MSRKSARRSTDYRHKKRRFYGNQHSKTWKPVAANVTSASSKKLCLDSSRNENNSTDTKGYRLINLDNFLGEISKLLVLSLLKLVFKPDVPPTYIHYKSSGKGYLMKHTPDLLCVSSNIYAFTKTQTQGTDNSQSRLMPVIQQVDLDQDRRNTAISN